MLNADRGLRDKITAFSAPPQFPNENRFHRFFSSELESFATSVLWNGGFVRTP
jgi:hypothetical protein